MAPTAENSQAIIDALDKAREALIDAQYLLNVAHERAQFDYEGNDGTIKNLPGANRVVLDAVCRELYTWGLFNDSRQRKEQDNG
jgi:hypothetical protein